MIKNACEGFLQVSFEDSDNFLKIKETLQRIGRKIPEEKIIRQLCYILHHKGNYYICHEKEMKEYFNFPSEDEMTLEDFELRNCVIRLLIDWDLCEPVNFDATNMEATDSIAKVKVLKYHDKKDWQVISMNFFGRK